MVRQNQRGTFFACGGQNPMGEEKRPSILVVDDEAAVRELLKLHLAGAGYDVKVADDAIVAGRSVMQAPPDLMVVDVAMPYLDGVDFVTALKADTTMPQVTVVFISGNAEVLERARRLGAPCLKKPFSADELLELVRRELMLRPPARRARLDYLSAST
jgi:DNA-binding response OmpR family regulator